MQRTRRYEEESARTNKTPIFKTFVVLEDKPFVATESKDGKGGANAASINATITNSTNSTTGTTATTTTTNSSGGSGGSGGGGGGGDKAADVVNDKRVRSIGTYPTLGQIQECVTTVAERIVQVAAAITLWGQQDRNNARSGAVRTHFEATKSNKEVLNRPALSHAYLPWPIFVELRQTRRNEHLFTCSPI